MDIELLDSVSFFLFSIILYHMSVLSKRLGEVMRWRKYYYIYYVGILFTLLASISRIVVIIYSGYFFFAIGMTLGLIASIKYWGWIFKEMKKT